MDVMLDLETLGTTPGSVILSIGAVEFDRASFGDRFEVFIDAASCQRAGLTIDAHTFMWWMRQSEAAREQFFREPGLPLNVALLAFNDWLRFRLGLLWSKGPSFDAAVLAAAYRAADLSVPWDFRRERCVRTVLDLAGIEGVQAYRQDGEVRHGAVADAMVQARAVQAAFQTLTKILA